MNIPNDTAIPTDGGIEPVKIIFHLLLLVKKLIAFTHICYDCMETNIFQAKRKYLIISYHKQDAIDIFVAFLEVVYLLQTIRHKHFEC